MKKISESEWPLIKLADVAEIRTGVAKNEDRELADPVELPYLRVANVQDGALDLREVKTIRVERARVERYSLQVGDVLLTEGGDFDKLGRGTVWNGQLDLCLHQNHIFAVRVDKLRLMPEFLSAYCSAETGRQYFLASSKQTTNLASINSSQLKEMPIPVPPIEVQKKIVFVLKLWDRAMQLTVDQLALTRSLHVERVERMLVSGQMGWPKGKLGEVCAINPANHRLSADAEAALVTMTDVDEFGRLKNQNVAKVGKIRGASGLTRFERGDVLCAKITPCFENGKGADTRGLNAASGLGSTEFHVLRPKELLSTLVHAVVHTPLFRKRGELWMTGSAGQKRVPSEFLADFPINVPPIAKQHSLAKLIEASSANILALESYVSMLRAQKNGLLQQLIEKQKQRNGSLIKLATELLDA